jgi:phosphoglycolate phosphatase-like HAD superfamily hydrolase
MAVALAAPAPAPQDPLPSWNDGPAKQSIIAFVASATTPGDTGYIPLAERIAVFDNDGTLWTEQPMYVQSAFIRDRLRALALEHPELLENPAVRSALGQDGGNGGGDDESSHFEPSAELLSALAAVHAGWTVEQFGRAVLDWLATARHPRFHRPYTDLVYQPMLELIRYLQQNGFRTWIVSGGGADFMRPWVDSVYGIPREQVVGSTIVVQYELRDTVPVLIRTPRIEFIDDEEGKPVGIHRSIGRRPAAAAGNSDGDRQMLEYTAGGTRARLMLLVHHDDCEREYCYDRESAVGRLDTALDEAQARGWTIVSMKRDWKVIYPFERGSAGRNSGGRRR